jgi:hypothetical protein
MPSEIGQSIANAHCVKKVIHPLKQEILQYPIANLDKKGATVTHEENYVEQCEDQRNCHFLGRRAGETNGIINLAEENYREFICFVLDFGGIFMEKECAIQQPPK